MASSPHNHKLGQTIYQSAEEVIAGSIDFVGATGERFDSRTATSYTIPALLRDIQGVRAVRQQLQEHMDMYGRHRTDSVSEAFRTILATIEDLLLRVDNSTPPLGLDTTRGRSSRLLSAPDALQRIAEEVHGAPTWADEELERANDYCELEDIDGSLSTTTYVDLNVPHALFREGTPTNVALDKKKAGQSQCCITSRRY
jgi:hypothetical protein